MDEDDERSQQGEDQEEEQEEIRLPEMWQFALEDKVGRVVKFLASKEEEELLEAVQEANPEDHKSLLLWATLKQKFVLVEWLIKKCKRDAFAFRDKTLLGVYDRWLEERKAKEERDREAAEDAAARAAEGILGDEEEEEKEPEPELWQTVLEGVEGDNIDMYVVRRVGELGLYEGGRDIHGNKNGVGQALFANGDMYIGEYLSNRREGLGTYYWAATGLMYCGEWKNNQRHGKGRMVYADGGKYYGQWLFDKKNGRGRYTYPNGDTYDGDWEDDVKEGIGAYTFAADSSQYVGTFRHGDFTSGRWLLSGNTTYHGVFRNYKPTGKGVFVFNGKFKQEGLYKAGRWVPVKVQNVKANEGLDLDLKVQGRNIALRFAAEASSQFGIEHLVSVANFRPFESWVRALDRQRQILVKDIRIQSLQLRPVGTEVEAVTLKFDAYDARLGEEAPKLPEDIITLRAPIDAIAIILCCEGQDYLVGVQTPQVTTQEFMTIELPQGNLTAAGNFDGPHMKKISAIFNLHLYREAMLNLNELFFGDGRQGLFTSPEKDSSRFTMWLFKQVVHSDYFNTLADRLEEYNRDGDIVKIVMQEAQELTSLVAGTRCSTVLTLLECLSDRIPQQTVAPQRPPTPPPPEPEPVPIYTAEELAMQQAALEAELAAKRRTRPATEEAGEEEEDD